MISKYLSYISFSHWMKVSVPIILLMIVFFMRGNIEDYVVKKIAVNTEKNKAELTAGLGRDNEKFAKALGAIAKIPEIDAVDYSNYKNRLFIKKQFNDITRTAKVESAPEKSVKTANAPKSEPIELGPPKKFIVSSIFLGKAKKFAVIDDKVVKVGDRLSSGEVVSSIKDGRVLISGRWGYRWLYVNY